MIKEPLVIDLDGTLTYADTLYESVLRLLRDRPFSVPRILPLLFRGRPSLKQYLAAQTTFNPETLPYNKVLLEWLKQQRANGRQLILCTAADHAIAQSIAGHLGIFDQIIASDGVVNMAGERKAEALVARFKHAGYDYVGNSVYDLPVWSRGRKAVVVNASPRLLNKARRVAAVEKVFPRPAGGFAIWAKVLRVQQWLKNILLFVSLLASHNVTNRSAWLILLPAFAAFSLCASSVYITNDLLDLESDRLHPRKRLRPFASGKVPVWIGFALLPLLLGSSMGLAVLAGEKFFCVLAVYSILTSAYSLALKRWILIDCFTLALLYTLRIIAGAEVIGNAISFWLLAFSVFLFLSLAFVKRYAELEVQCFNGKKTIHGRGYQTSDAALIQTMGMVSGYASVLVLALYLNSDLVLKLYKTPWITWGYVLVMLFWISWVWMQAHRGNMHDDPLIFAIKDRVSLSIAALLAVLLVISTASISW